MTPRSDLIWMDIDDDLATVKQKASQEIHSVYLVVNKSLDDLEGSISVKTIFPLNLTDENFKLENYLKESIIVHENATENGGLLVTFSFRI